MNINFKPRVRNGFSDRNGYETISNIIQKDDLDIVSRNKIINIFDKYYYYAIENDGYEIISYIYKTIFCLTEDDIPKYSKGNYYENDARNDITENMREWKIYDVFTFLEEFTKWIVKKFKFHRIYDEFNSLFKMECVGYRFIDGKICDIIAEHEIQSLDSSLKSPYQACKISIEKALNYLYDKEKPDYPNSVKESISAIEGMCNIIIGSNSTSLGKALEQLEKKGISIHPAMKKAFESLYGYTSDKSGIRHNGGVDENTTYEEAKYMLISCSAFLNYLVEIYSNANPKK